ncbi:hypothetical protein ACFXTH_043056 [Malus domestica]
MLIVAGTQDVQVRLCDIASGAFAHTLSGHRGMSQNSQNSTFDAHLIHRKVDNHECCKNSLLTNGSGAKHSPIGKGPVKGSMKQRLHPGMLSSQDRATAHYGAVTGLKVTEDGMYLLSAGSDSRLRLWDIESGCNTLVNFETVRMQTSKPIQLATS